MDKIISLYEAKGLEATILNIVDSTLLDENDDLVTVRQFVLEVDCKDGTKSRTYLIKRSRIRKEQESKVSSTHREVWSLLLGDRVRIVGVIDGYDLILLSGNTNTSSVKSFS